MARSEVFARKTGEFIARRIIQKPFESWVNRRIKRLDMHVSGLDNLTLFDGQPFILAANHVEIGSRFRILPPSGLGPDSFAIQEYVDNLHVVARYNSSERVAKILHPRALSVLEEFQKGLLIGGGYLPIRTNNGGLNDEFRQRIGEVVERHEPILIFPGGRTFDFQPERIRRGTAVISQEYNLPIVPAYIDGANTWGAHKVVVKFGEPIYPEGKTVEEMTALVGDKILSLK
ncbi:MAG TPA: lysophospholipid acyltransferase family protein [Patescibacteria group bacterium]|nr:lysophospholipid acyltransferase family protein [Patescibacteria group bacterium]